MRNEEAELDYTTCERDQDWYRLIPSRFPIVDPFERLGPPALRAAAAEIEALTNPRLAEKARLIGGPGSVDERSSFLQNWNHAPFAYKNPEGTRFLNPTYGVMEVAATIHAALAFAVQRRETFLSNTDEAPMDLDMRLLTNRIRGKFIDLTALGSETTKTDRWAIGRVLHERGESGVLFRRPRIPDGVFLAVFDQKLPERGLQATHYRFVWDGKFIKSIYDFTTGEAIPRSDLLPSGEGREAA